MQKLLIIATCAVLVSLGITAVIASGGEPSASSNLPLVASAMPIVLLAANVSSDPVEPPNPSSNLCRATPPPGVYQANLDRMWILVPKPMDEQMVIGVTDTSRFTMPVVKPDKN
jgi:hypothetical protein